MFLAKVQVEKNYEDSHWLGLDKGGLVRKWLTKF